MTQAPSKTHDQQQLDALTGGAFTAATSGERAARIREWLATDPAHELMQEVFKELSSKDKGAVKPLREKLDELRRAKGQEALSAEWAARGQALLETARLNIADAMAWQRDAAKAGAPLSREPLATLRNALAERVKIVEDLQNQAMVQREAAVLLAQRIELLSTKSWKDAQAVSVALGADVQHWQDQASALEADANWPSVDAKFTPMVESARAQLLVVWESFGGALALAVAAAEDASAALPAVPMWAQELRAARGTPGDAEPRAARPKVDPAIREEQRRQAAAAMLGVLEKVEQEVSEGHGKATAGAAAALRNAFKEHGRHLDSAMEARVHAALGAAGELEGWQRWRADQLREELVAKAEALIERKPKARVKVRTRPARAVTAADPAADASPAVAETVTEDVTAAPTLAPRDEQAPAAHTAPVDSGAAAPEATAETQPSAEPVGDVEEPTPPPAAEEPVAIPKLGGRKMQETLRNLREQWKTTDQGGPPNHALWKRFDEACNEAHKIVEAWLDKLKAEHAEHRAQRLALVDEVKAWTQRNVERTEPHEWKAFARALHKLSDRWRDAGHLSEKAFAELQPLWKAAIHAAAAPLENAQKESLARRQALIAEAVELGAAPVLRIDAVRSLQQRWQAEAQTVTLERKSEQKLWDAFRKPIDDAFNRKTQEREQAASALSARDNVVLQAAKALEAANASGDAQRIRAAMSGLEAALRGQAEAAAEVTRMGPEDDNSDQKAAVASVEWSDSAPEREAKSADSDLQKEAAAGGAGAEPGADSGAEPEAGVPTSASGETSDAAVPAAGAAPAPAPAAPVRKPVVAMRGDDRPGNRRSEPAQSAGRGGKFGDRKDAPRGSRPGDNKFEPRRDDRSGRGPRGDDRGGRFGDRPAFEDRGPRLGDTAFRAQRDAKEHAEAALRKLAAQAHGEALTQLLTAWEKRSADAVPGQQELGRAVTPAVRGAWVKAIEDAPAGDAAQNLLRLEMAAELPTPAEHLDARRAMQLQLLTRRNDPPPAQTWGEDAAQVLAAPYHAASARRMQNALKVLLKR